jgi:hypothetical protein
LVVREQGGEKGRRENGREIMVSVAMPHSRLPETMKTTSGSVILAGDASPEQVGIHLVP